MSKWEITRERQSDGRIIETRTKIDDRPSSYDYGGDSGSSKSSSSAGGCLMVVAAVIAIAIGLWIGSKAVSNMPERESFYVTDPATGQQFLIEKNKDVDVEVRFVERNGQRYIETVDHPKK